MARSDLKQKFDTLVAERNILSEKIKNLEATNVEDKVSADVINQSPFDNSTESVCSFKTASSSIHEKNVFKKKRSFYVKSLRNHSKKGQMVWRVKSSPDEKKNDKASASTSNAKKNRAHKGTQGLRGSKIKGF
ncbi:hypothetical protein L6452_09212 [Arctium lappa]|uniref:Uncharacterized protein n=1 Tax=Arctium lappa TaxID=4217 RepID=A0ACB9DKF2_ARCLA|nr:hypothetical protein L6452_09212 [Arctium lappa]